MRLSKFGWSDSLSIKVLMCHHPVSILMVVCFIPSSRWAVFPGAELGWTPAAPPRLRGPDPPTSRRQTELVPTWRTRCCPAWPARSQSSPTSESRRSPRSSCSSSSLSPTLLSWRPAAIAKLWGKAEQCVWRCLRRGICVCTCSWMDYWRNQPDAGPRAPGHPGGALRPLHV